MSYHDDGAHPVAKELKAGEVPTINPWDLLDQAQAQERDLRAKLAAAEALAEELIRSRKKQVEMRMKYEQERDAARRELGEAVAILMTVNTMNPQNVTVSAFLARHEQSERRKGERRKKSISVHAVAEKRAHCSDRRKQPEAVDWPAPPAKVEPVEWLDPSEHGHRDCIKQLQHRTKALEAAQKARA